MGRGEFLELDQSPPAAEVDDPAGPIIRDHIFYLERGNQAMLEGEAESALRYFSRALEQHLQLTDAWVGQCLALLDRGEPAEAQLWAEKALGHCPGSAPLFAARASGLIREGLAEKGMAFVDAALKVRQDHWLPWMARAEALTVDGKAASAERCLSKCFESGGAPRWWLMRRAGEMLLLFGEPGRAIQYLLQAVELEPRRAVNHLRAAQAYHLLFKPDRARDYLDQALALRPDHPEARSFQDEVDGEGLLGRLGRRLQANARRKR